MNHDDIFLRTSGAQIVTRSGLPVVLKGTALGGWMNMENYSTGYAGTETLHRAALHAALGGDLYARFFDRWLDVFFTEQDAAFLASLGLNCLRLPVNYRHFEDDMAPFELKENGFRVLDRAIARAASRDLYTIIDLHALPGFQNQHWHCDNPTHWAFFWDHKHFQDRVVNLWEVIAHRYRDNPWVAGYNLMNEPSDATGQRIRPYYERLRDAVRAIDADRILFVEGNMFSSDFSIFGEVWPNTVYSFHYYPRSVWVDGGPYPGVTGGQFIDRSVVERETLRRTQFMRENGAPIWLGEFGAVFAGAEDVVATRYMVLEDQFE
ncbi:MAG: glycoside hydrolase family 5 protein, partial [Mycobacteriales bacterium]